ncbi:unnamed protein product [Ectocarpus fasciculatus]
MACLARARIRHERYNECLLVIAMAVLCLCLGHDDLFDVMSSVLACFNSKNTTSS